MSRPDLSGRVAGFPTRALRVILSGGLAVTEA